MRGRVLQVKVTERSNRTKPADAHVPQLAHAILWHLQADHRAKCAATEASGHNEVPTIMPQAALEHVAFARRHGEDHVLIPVPRNFDPHFVLDMPWPRKFESQPWRCSTCHNRGLQGYRMQQSKGCLFDHHLGNVHCLPTCSHSCVEDI